MGASKSLIGLVFVTIMTGMISRSESYVFTVGDRSGWVENPPVPYNNWAGSKRFSINDSLVFNYNKGHDYVLVVKKESYDSCNVSSPIETLTDSNSAYKLVSAGPHYFISATAGRCGKGLKMIVVVLSIRNKPAPSTPSAPTPSTPSAPTPSTPVSPPPPKTPSSSSVCRVSWVSMGLVALMIGAFLS